MRGAARGERFRVGHSDMVLTLSPWEQEGEWIGEDFASDLAQEAAGLFFSDIAGTHCQTETQRKRREDIQHADDCDTGESQGRILPIQLAVHVRGRRERSRDWRLRG